MTEFSEVCISGPTLSSFITAAYSCSPGTKYSFALYGRRIRIKRPTDADENASSVSVVIHGAAAPRATVESATSSGGDVMQNDEVVGTLSIYKSVSHVVSWQDTNQLLRQSRGSGETTILFLVTESLSPNRGSRKVDFTVFQSTGGSVPVTVPLQISNAVDSFGGFKKIIDVFERYEPTTNSTTAPAENTASSNLHSGAERSYRKVHDLVHRKNELIKSILALNAQQSATY